MKQYITLEQVNELSKEGREKLRKWLWRPEMMGRSRVVAWELSIGEMIEFLGEDYKYAVITSFGDQERTTTEVVDPNKLCDALWEAVKDILNA